VLLVGQATRLQPYVDGEPKVYEATIRFGAETDTGDPTGMVVREAPLPSDERVADAIERLTGRFEQAPPAYSAKQVGGVRAYAAARQGKPLALRPVPIVVHEWTVLARTGRDLDVRVSCGGGTYIRSLARDLGELSGSAAHVRSLRRVRSGPFHVTEASSLAALAAGAASILPPIAAVAGLPAERLTSAATARVARGQPVPASLAGERAALVDDTGRLVAIAERSDDAWQPRLVLPTV
jgi:tRNA pseudouridine55 synthase